MVYKYITTLYWPILETELITVYYSFAGPEVQIGFPRPMVNPLVPSGILGPFVICLVDDPSHCGELDDIGDDRSEPRPVWIGVRSRDLPRPRAHPFFAADELSSAYKTMNHKLLN